MAYLDANNPRRAAGTAVVVAALEAGLALAVIAGLSYRYTTHDDPPIRAIDFKLDEPVKKKDPPKPRTETPRIIERPEVIREPLIPLGAGPTIVDRGLDIGGGEAIGEVTFPIATPSPSPSFVPIKARPRGNPANWVTENDYPTSEIRLEHEGVVRFRLSLDTSGKVTDCIVTSSSGWPVLDAAACDKLTRRARFEPATDATGARTEGVYNGAVNWRMPKD